MVLSNNFAETYNNRRQHGIECVASLPKIVLTARDWGPLSAGGPQVRNGAIAEGYRLVRSDLEEDRLRQSELPSMPGNSGVLRARTTVFHSFTRRPQEEEESSTYMAWADSGWFHAFSGIMICVNALLIGMETEIESDAWFWIEQFLLAFFTLELLLRLARVGWRFFLDRQEVLWNVFDLFIVLSGVCDQWIIPVLTPIVMQMLNQSAEQEDIHKGRMSLFFMLMRMLRLLRIVRLFRLVRIVRPLYELAQGVLEALQGLFWVLIFLLMTLNGVGIVCTRLIGHGDIVAADDNSEHGRSLREIVKLFATVGDSMFALFGTMSSWSLLKFAPMFGEMPWLKPLFVVFYVYSAWALLAVMTGVVSENMIAIREQMVKEDEQREEVRKSMVTKLLFELFQQADADNSGCVSKSEFESLLRSPELCRKIEKNTHLKIKDLEDLFDWLDHDGGGSITIDEFMKGFRWVNEPLRAKSLVKLQERLASDLKRLESNVAGTFEDRTSEVVKLIAAPLRKIHAITEQMQTLDVHFNTRIRSGIKHDGLELPTPQDVRDVERRLMEKMGRVVSRLEEIEWAAGGRPPKSRAVRSQKSSGHFGRMGTSSLQTIPSSGRRPDSGRRAGRG